MFSGGATVGQGLAEAEIKVGATERGTRVPILTPVQHRAVADLAQGHTHGMADEAAGVHRLTVTRWAKNPAFVEELDRLRSESFRSVELSNTVVRIATPS